jgi:hypothetical protein
LRVDLDAVVGGEGFPQQPAVLGERLRIHLRADLVQELRRALEVGEYEGDSAGWKLPRHDLMMTRPARL